MKTVLSARINGEIEDTLLLCEHPPVYTVGRTRDAAKNIINPHNVPIVEVARGGDVTFHGPGQIVGYPIFQLPDNRHDLHGFMRGLEEMMIRTLSHLGVSAQRDARNTGVWIEGAKVMAIGISARRWVIWHGFALNLDTDLAERDGILGIFTMVKDWQTRVASTPTFFFDGDIRATTAEDQNKRVKVVYLWECAVDNISNTFC